jgi:hypothetical protein
MLIGMAKKEKKKKDKERNTPADYSRLRTECFKLRGIGYLLEHQGDDGFAELDEPDVWYGIGLILRSIHDEIISVARQIENEQIAEAVANADKD